MIHRRALFYGIEAAVEILKIKENVEFILETSVREIKGQKRLEEILLDNGKKISVTGLFVAIGSLPAADLIEKYVQRDENGYVIAGEDGLTSSSGLFVAGDVRTKKLRQVITAVSDGANAAASAIHYLKFCRKR